ncbi:MAG TPA: acetyl ornithine aminotransferase family protein [Planctomycetaceae bacterium]|nr:acetyl ornithine aminotransferase family protein [Planctomycetaceae bacterium]
MLRLLPENTRPSLEAPVLRTSLPGPRAQALIQTDRRYTSPSYTRVYPLVAERGEGAVIEDVDGNRFLDFTAGIAVCATGHCHPRVVSAIRRQAGRLIHMSGTDFYYAPQAELARTLAELAPGAGENRVFFTNSGTESIEAAFKLARAHTGRKRVLAFLGSFHGRTMGALSLTASKVIQKRGFGPLVPGVVHVEYPNPYRPLGCPPEQVVDLCLERIETLFRTELPPDEVAAIFVEPIQGEGGYVVPPADFHPRLKALAAQHGILYVADEVQTGMGRTGRMFALEHWGVEPDILCLAKGIASGLPLGAIVARADVMDWKPGAHASTFGGNPLSCVAALETIALLEDELMENAARVGEFLRARLRDLQPRHALIGEVRGRGLMVGVELVRDRQTKAPAADECQRVIQACFRRGLLLLTSGVSTIRFCPPLVISEAQAETAVRILDEALGEAA